MDMKAIQEILNVLEEHHQETLLHMERTALYSLALARRLELNKEEKELAYFVGFLHDVGKMCLPVNILDKKDDLSEYEKGLVMGQTYYSSNIIKTRKGFEDVANLIRFVQEKYDGTGFPNGLKGDNIPLIAKIVHIADEYDILRFGVKHMKHQDALLVLRQWAGTEFDPELVEPFIRAVVKEGLLKLDEDLK